METLFHLDVPESEYCLSINVFAPASPPPPGGRPVLLFIPGGGWQSGNGIADFSGIAGYENIIVMSINYRTNSEYILPKLSPAGHSITQSRAVFGFPSTSAIPVEQRNLGIYDQRLAIDWIQRNAAAFGGDSAKVTIWGESAGALSVDIHVKAYADADPPPFRAAIMFSGQLSFGPMSIPGIPGDTRLWDAISQEVGCGNMTASLSCMRNVSAKALVDAQHVHGSTFIPYADNITLPASLPRPWRDGRVVKVPLLMGTTAEEGRLLINRNITKKAFEATYLSEPLVNQTQRDAIYAHYTKNQGLNSTYDISAAIYTDFMWKCASTPRNPTASLMLTPIPQPQGILANASSAIMPTWQYQLNKSLAPILPKKYNWLGKFHGSDITLLFSSTTFDSDQRPEGLTADLSTFANHLRSIVGRFTRNPSAGPGWPAVASSFAPFDMAVLGDIGDHTASGTTSIDHTDYYEVCELYRDIYSASEASM